MFWSRRLIPRLSVIAALGLASIAGTGDLALPDEHFMFGGEAAADHVTSPHSALSHDSGSSSDTQPEHTCHCVHAHGLAVAAAPDGHFTVEAPLTAAPVQLATEPTGSATPPPFHPPKLLS